MWKDEISIPLLAHGMGSGKEKSSPWGDVLELMLLRWSVKSISVLFIENQDIWIARTICGSCAVMGSPVGISSLCITSFSVTVTFFFLERPSTNISPSASLRSRALMRPCCLRKDALWTSGLGSLWRDKKWNLMRTVDHLPMDTELDDLILIGWF